MIINNKIIYVVFVSNFLLFWNCIDYSNRSYRGTIEEYLNQEKKDSSYSASIPGFSDSLTLKNGQTITNVKTKIAGDSVVVDYPDGSTKVFKKAQVKAVNRN